MLKKFIFAVFFITVINILFSQETADNFVKSSAEKLQKDAASFVKNNQPFVIKKFTINYPPFENIFQFKLHDSFSDVKKQILLKKLYFFEKNNQIIVVINKNYFNSDKSKKIFVRSVSLKFTDNKLILQRFIIKENKKKVKTLFDILNLEIDKIKNDDLTNDKKILNINDQNNINLYFMNIFFDVGADFFEKEIVIDYFISKYSQQLGDAQSDTTFQADEFSVGFSYSGMFISDYNYMNGGYQQIFAVPFTYSHFYSPFSSIGFAVKSAYKFNIYTIQRLLPKSQQIMYDQSFYNSISVVWKTSGFENNFRYIFSPGLSFSLKFIDYPEGTLGSFDHNISAMSETYIKPGNYILFNPGTVFFFGFEILNRSRNFSFIIGVPIDFSFEFLPSYTADKSETKSDKSYTIKTTLKDPEIFANVSVGFEMRFQFNHFKLRN